MQNGAEDMQKETPSVQLGDLAASSTQLQRTAYSRYSIFKIKEKHAKFCSRMIELCMLASWPADGKSAYILAYL